MKRKIRVRQVTVPNPKVSLANGDPGKIVLTRADYTHFLFS